MVILVKASQIAKVTFVTMENVLGGYLDGSVDPMHNVQVVCVVLPVKVCFTKHAIRCNMGRNALRMETASTANASRTSAALKG